MSGPQRRTDLEVGEVADGSEVVLLDPKTDRVVSINASAAAIWYLCDGERDTAALEREVLEVLPHLEPQRVQEEVKTALKLLADNHLLES